MDPAVALWILVPLAAVHVLGRRNRALLLFQLLVDVVLVLLPGRILVRGLHIGPGVPGAAGWGAPVATAGSPEQSDLPLEFAPWWEEVRRLVARGEPPWISDRIGGGAPLYANGQTGLPFPLHAPVWALGAARGSDVMAVWKLELSALGGFFLLGRLGVRPAASMVGSLAYAFGLYQLSWLVVPLAWVVALAPWAWWALVGALRGERRHAALLAVVLGALAGWSVHPESAAFLWLALAVGGVLLAWGRRRRMVRLLVPFALAIPVAAVGAIPTLATIADSSKLAAARTGPAGQPAAVTWSLRGRMAALLLAPWREGEPADGSWAEPFPNAAVALAVGAVPVAFLATAVAPRRRHRRFALAAGAVGLGAAALVYQVPGIFPLAARAPVLGVMTWVRCGFLVGFALAFLAAVALDSWLRRPRRARLAAAAVAVTAAAVVLALTGPRRAGSVPWPGALLPAVLAAGAVAPPVVAVGAPLLVALDAARLGWNVLPASRPGDAAVPLVAGLREAVAGEGGRVLGVASALPPNLASVAGLADLRSADPVRPIGLARLHAALGAAGADLPGPVTTPWPGLAGAWSVRWLAAPPAGPTGPAASGWQETFWSGEGRLYRNPRALPVLRLAVNAVVPPEGPEAGAWEIVDFASSAVTAEAMVLGGEGTLEVAADRPARHEARVRCRGRVLAVLHVPRAPGWRAYLDGRRAAIVDADLGAMGVVVPEGVHTVSWAYSPPGLTAGVLLTLAGLAGCLALALSSSRRRS